MPLETSASSPLAPPPLPADRLLAGADAARIGLFETDLATGASAWSDAVWALMGRRRGDIPATLESWRAHIHPDDLPAMRAAYDAAQAGDGLYSATYRMRRADTGELRWIDARGRIVRGPPDRFVGVVVDVTDRRGEEAALRDSEARFRQLVEVAPTMMWVGDAAGMPVYVNARWREYTGHADAGPASWERAVHPDDAAPSWAAWHDAVARGVPFEIELRLRERASGEYRWFRSSAAPLRGEAGAVERWVGVVTDVHARRLAAERATALQRLMEALGGAVDEEAVSRVLVREVQAALGARVVGLWLPSADGASLERVEATELPEEVRRRWVRLALDQATPATTAFRTGAAVFLETPAAIAARFPRLAEVFGEAGLRASVALPLQVEGRRVGALSVGFDGPRAFGDDERAQLDALAQQAALAIDRAHLYEAERRAHADAERARTEAEAASRAKSEFLAIMSHELRTPLNAIAGHVELLEMGIHGELSERQLDALGRVARAQRHLLALINDVLNLSRIESGRVEYVLANVDLRDVLHAVAPLIEPQLAARRLTYDVRLPEAPLVVRADRDKLQQVLLNLLANAVKYTEPGGRVTVDTASRAGTGAVAFLRVADTGCGIAREKLDQVFEPFVRVDSAHTRRTDGAGLGLAIARDLARGMGGDLRARSVVGEGSTFTVQLPLA